MIVLELLTSRDLEKIASWVMKTNQSSDTDVQIYTRD